MKHQLCIIVLLTLPLLVSAQRFKGGIIGGITASQVDGDQLAGFNKLGLTYGVYTNTFISDNWRTQLELKCSGRGAFGNRGTKDNPDLYQLNLHYVEMPLSLATGISSKIAVEAGLAFAYLMNFSLYDSHGKVPASEFTQQYKSTDYNFFSGASYILNEKTELNIRYSYSMFPIRKRDFGYYYGYLARLLGYRDGDYNNFLSISIYYHLHD